MKFFASLLVLAGQLLAVHALPASNTLPATYPIATSCPTPAARVEWRQLDTAQKTTYINAALCLTKKPSRLGLNTTRFEDFAYVHSHLSIQIHFVAQFLPWHRYFTHLYEQALRMECAYQGPMPYWNWVLDNAAPPKSPIWSPTTGFGGNGNGTGFQSPSRPGPLLRCVTDGPFKNLKPTYRDTNIEPHCLNRAWNDFPKSTDVGRMQGEGYTPAIMANISASPTFQSFWRGLENGPHGSVHQGISGDMGPSTSPNDPIFFVHHAQIDRVWWRWQQQKLPARLTAFGGPKTIAGSSTASLDDVMPMMKLGPDVKVRDVMSTTTGLLCYKY